MSDNAQRPYCKYCGSSDVGSDAAAAWDYEKQCWSLTTTFDNSTCNECGKSGDNILMWRKIHEDN